MIKEEVINTEIGNILRGYLHGADIKVEENDQLEDGTHRPDFVVKRDSREDILVENKIDNERELIRQCRARCNGRWSNDQQVRVVIGLLTPKKCQAGADSSKLRQALLENHEFRWVLWQDKTKFPSAGWLQGSLQDLAGFIDRTGADAVDLGLLMYRIKRALKQEAVELGRNKFSHGLFGQILKQEPGEQTTRMGLAIIFNAIIFQIHISRHHTHISHPSQMLGDGEARQAQVCLLWREILNINYLPIFALARQLVICLKDDRLANDMLHHLFAVASAISERGGFQGLIGLIFGELIKDRKLLASFYTMPNPAFLLSELAIDKMEVDWSDIKQIQSLRIADLAVGTGTLMVAVYKRLAERYMLTGNNPDKLHKMMMEEVMAACDVDPVAIHITVARLSGEYPHVDYTSTQVYAMPYGLTKMNGGREYRLGSLDLLKENRALTLFGDASELVTPLTKPKIPRVDKYNAVDIGEESLDFIIMNPPFTRSTNHEKFQAGFPNPAFAALGNNEESQKAMGKVLKKHLDDIKNKQGILASHGNAGLGSNFMDLAHVKLKPGGILAFVLPITAISGSAWSNFRKLLASCYEDIIFVSLSAHGKYGRNWSSDTSLSEVMLVAKKSLTPTKDNSQAWYVTLNEQPQTANEAIAMARSIKEQPGDGDLKVGRHKVGWMIKDDLEARLGNPSGIKNSDLVILGKNLLSAKLILPRVSTLKIPLVNLSTLGNLGALHRDINGLNADQSPRGAFDIVPLDDRRVYDGISYPALWNHDTEAEKMMIVTPDAQGRVRQGMRDRAVKTWQGYRASRRTVGGASRLHISSDFGTMSQSLGACLTPIETLGGSAWPSLQIKDNILNEELAEKVICLWLNTTLGLIGRWYISNRQHPGRSRMTISTIGFIPVVDVRQLTKSQIQQLAEIFDKYAKVNLKSAYLLDQDAPRQSMDEEVYKVLQLPARVLKSLDILRQQWSEESSVRGSKT